MPQDFLPPFHKSNRIADGTEISFADAWRRDMSRRGGAVSVDRPCAVREPPSTCPKRRCEERGDDAIRGRPGKGPDRFAFRAQGRRKIGSGGSKESLQSGPRIGDVALAEAAHPDVGLLGMAIETFQHA